MVLSWAIEVMRWKEEHKLCSCRFLTFFKVCYCYYYPGREIRVCKPELNTAFIFDTEMICKATFNFSSSNKQFDSPCISEIKKPPHL